MPDPTLTVLAMHGRTESGLDRATPAHEAHARQSQEPAPPPPPTGETKARRGSLARRIGALVRAIEDNDGKRIEEAVLNLSRSRRIFAPLGFLVGSFILLFDGLRLLVTNWRLLLVQIPPAVWIWAAMYDLKAHVLHGKSFNALRGPVVIPLVLVVAAITVASFFLNAVFAFAIDRRGTPEVRPAVAKARSHLKPIVISGGVVGLLLGFSTMIVTRWGRPWFTVSLSIVVGLMMICYVTVPARIVGLKPVQSRREKLKTTAVGGLLSTAVCTPPYMLGRLGILMLGSKALLIPGVILLVLGATLHAGATGAVRAIKLTAKLTTPERAVEPTT
jgi:hypothetical protein